MSQQPRHGSASGPSRLVSANTSPAGTASSGQGSPTGRTSAAESGAPRSEQLADRGLTLPRIRPQDVRQETIVTPGGTERPRALGVHSILNPPESSSPRGQRRTISEVDSPQDSQGSYFPRAPSSTRSKDSDVSPTNAAPTWEGPPRRILSPRSPSAHRSGSMGYIKPPTGTIDAQRSPFVPSASISRPYTSEPGASGVPLPSPALSQPQQPPHNPMPLNPLSRRASLQQGQASASTSPSTAYSSISHLSTEPHYQYSTASSVQSRQPSVGPGPQTSIHPPPHSVPPRSHNPTPMGFNNPPSAGTSTQSAYQLMTVETHHGPIQVPVDVQAASRVADEKRRRNAGASARFRQRRKQKELHANQTINRLEQQLRDAEEDAEFYRRERDLLRDVAWNTQDRERFFPRPQSPRHRRKPLPTVDVEGDVSGEEGSGSGSQSRDTESQSGYVQTNPAQRRRTSAFGMGPHPGESQTAGYAPGAPPMPGPSHQPHQPPQHQQYFSQPAPASYPPPQHHQAQPHPQHPQHQHPSPHPHGAYQPAPPHQSQQPPPR